MKRTFVFVVATAGSALIALAAGCSKPATTVPDPALATGVTVGKPDPPKFTGSGTDAMTDEFGIHKKVIITQRNVRPTQTPGGALTGDPVKYFWPYFVFETSPGTGTPAQFRIGTTPRKESIVGWVSSGVAAEWRTRIGMRYLGGFPLQFYASIEPLKELVRKGKTAAAPVARVTPGAPQGWMPWPVAESEEFTHGGKVYQFVRVQFLAEYRGGADLSQPPTAPPAGAGGGSYSTAEKSGVVNRLKSIDLVFVVDNTMSTTPFITGIREAMTQIVRKIQASPEKIDLNVGLVLYRDHVPAILFAGEDGKPSVVKRYPLTGDLDGFVRTVAPLQAATDGSEEAAEAGYDGVLAGLNGPWRDALAQRVIVHISDNSFHPPGHRKNPHHVSPSQLIELAKSKEKRVKIVELCIKGDGGDDEQALHRRQCDELAAGTGGVCYELSDHARVADEVCKVQGSTEEVARDYSRITQKIINNDTADVDPRKLTTVIEFLEGAGVDVKKLRGVPTFGSAWCLTEVAGRPVLDADVYIGRPELRLLLAALQNLCVHLNTKDAHKLSLASRVAGDDFFDGHYPEPFDAYLMSKGVPVRTGLLRLKKEEIEHMDEARRAALRDDLEANVIPRLQNALTNNRRWASINGVDFGWIKEKDLP